MGNFNRDRGSRGGGRPHFGQGFKGRGGFDRGGRNERQMFKTVCSNCGKDCEVPFRPTGDKPVYCSECFEKMGDRGERRSFDRPRFNDRKSQGDQYKAQFEEINAKLGQILNLLQPKSSESLPQEPGTVAEAPAPTTKVKTSKTKKVTKDKAKEE